MKSSDVFFKKTTQEQPPAPETVTVELPKDVVEFMTDLAREIKEQDNRATASPYFYIVQGKRDVIAPDGYGDGDTHYYCWDWSQGATAEDWEEIIEQHNEENPRDRIDDVQKFLQDKCDTFGMHEIDVEENVFLTYRGYQDHMKQNEHNYRHLKKVYSYVKHAFRNPEMENLHKAIMAFDKGE